MSHQVVLNRISPGPSVKSINMKAACCNLLIFPYPPPLTNVPLFARTLMSPIRFEVLWSILAMSLKFRKVLRRRSLIQVHETGVGGREEEVTERLPPAALLTADSLMRACALTP